MSSYPPDSSATVAAADVGTSREGDRDIMTECPAESESASVREPRSGGFLATGQP